MAGVVDVCMLCASKVIIHYLTYLVDNGMIVIIYQVYLICIQLISIEVCSCQGNALNLLNKIVLMMFARPFVQ